MKHLQTRFVLAGCLLVAATIGSSISKLSGILRFLTMMATAFFVHLCHRHVA
jgi:hypothetical protein